MLVAGCIFPLVAEEGHGAFVVIVRSVQKVVSAGRIAFLISSRVLIPSSRIHINCSNSTAND